jgi:hypothetical protein
MASANFSPRLTPHWFSADFAPCAYSTSRLINIEQQGSRSCGSNKKKTGRPLNLTEVRFRRMLALIPDGNTNSAACRIEGITYSNINTEAAVLDKISPEQLAADLAIADQIRQQRPPGLTEGE